MSSSGFCYGMSATGALALLFVGTAPIWARFCSTALSRSSARTISCNLVLNNLMNAQNRKSQTTIAADK